MDEGKAKRHWYQVSADTEEYYDDRYLYRLQRFAGFCELRVFTLEGEPVSLNVGREYDLKLLSNIEWEPRHLLDAEMQTLRLI